MPVMVKHIIKFSQYFSVLQISKPNFKSVNHLLFGAPYCTRLLILSTTFDHSSIEHVIITEALVYFCTSLLVSPPSSLHLWCAFLLSPHFVSLFFSFSLSQPSSHPVISLSLWSSLHHLFISEEMGLFFDISNNCWYIQPWAMGFTLLYKEVIFTRSVCKADWALRSVSHTD